MKRACAMLLLTPGVLLAHGSEPHLLSPARPRNLDELWTTWAWEPFSWLGLILSAWLYARGLRRLWSVMQPGHGIRTWEAWSFAGGWLALFMALVSPLHPWGSVLFSAHMTQHEILMLVAAPLLVLGRPLIAFLKGLPRPWVGALVSCTATPWWQRTWRFVTNAFVAWLIHALALWAWHIPALFQATLKSEFVHALQHISFLGSALLFWWAVIDGRQKLMGYGVAVLFMFTTALHSGLLGALLTFANIVWYPVYAGTTASWGLTPLEDQRLGGLIMWMPAGLVYIVAGLALFAGWMRESESRVLRWEASTLR
ncbi:MAG TPA: cytochrome c oxidase assembly protein [Verrucomicrobiae bacterium]|nr:cytochrome c oxidase assembly protein [Verrucomicrobiae bacterium]